ncbi:MAG: PAS domain-containing protein [Anaerolineae bacterium]|nr:PAS domain-containing protein [Anaerolineae bacterium]
MQQEQSKLGIIMTNQSHRIIFLDRNICQFLDYPAAQLGKLIGSPFQTVIDLDTEQYSALVTGIQSKHQTQTQEIPLRIISKAGDILPVVADVFVNQDMHRNVFGVDFTLYQAPQQPETLPDVDIEDYIAEEAVKVYFQQQIKAIVTVIEQWNGASLAQYLSDMTTYTAQRQGWDIDVTHESIHIGQNITSDNLLALLDKSAAYAFMVLGKGVVTPHLESINQNTPDIVFESIDPNWFQKL